MAGESSDAVTFSSIEIRVDDVAMDGDSDWTPSTIEASFSMSFDVRRRDWKRMKRAMRQPSPYVSLGRIGGRRAYACDLARFKPPPMEMTLNTRRGQVRVAPVYVRRWRRNTNELEISVGRPRP